MAIRPRTRRPARAKPTLAARDLPLLTYGVSVNGPGNTISIWFETEAQAAEVFNHNDIVPLRVILREGTDALQIYSIADPATTLQDSAIVLVQDPPLTFNIPTTVARLTLENAVDLNVPFIHEWIRQWIDAGAWLPVTQLD